MLSLMEPFQKKKKLSELHFTFYLHTFFNPPFSSAFCVKLQTSSSILISPGVCFWNSAVGCKTETRSSVWRFLLDADYFCRTSSHSFSTIMAVLLAVEPRTAMQIGSSRSSAVTFTDETSCKTEVLFTFSLFPPTGRQIWTFCVVIYSSSCTVISTLDPKLLPFARRLHKNGLVK